MFKRQLSFGSVASSASATSASFLSDRMILLPSPVGPGKVLWERFARQLHLPVQTVLKKAAALEDRYFMMMTETSSSTSSVGFIS
jgi:hypothetical protein